MAYMSMCSHWMGGVDAGQVRKVSRLKKYLNAKKSTFGRRRTLFKNIVMAVGKVILLPFSVHDIVAKIDKISRQSTIWRI